MCPEGVSLFEGSCLKAGALSLKPDVLHTLDSLYAFYHRQWWCYSHMYRVFKLRQALLKGMALPGGGGGHDCRLYLREYHCSELPGRLGNRTQRMKRFQEICHQGGQVPICLHHVCQDLDRAPNLRTRHPIRRRQFSGQDADFRRYHHRFLVSHLRSMHAKASLSFLFREPGGSVLCLRMFVMLLLSY